MSEDRWPVYRFATWDALDPAKFGGQSWVSLENQWGQLLDPRATPATAPPPPGASVKNLGA